MWLLPVACFFMGLTWGVAPAQADPRIRVVRAGDSLSELALEYRVSVGQLRRWNHLSGDAIQIGQRLVVSPPRGKRRATRRSKSTTLTTYVVKAHDTLSGIAKRFRLSLADIRRWNPKVHPLRLRRGQKLKVSPRRLPPSASVGRPYSGQLENGRRLDRHPTYVIRDRRRAYGTEETLHLIGTGFDAVRRRHPRAPRVRIHDLSLRQGGRMSGHRSHQSGRDVDLTYFQRRCPRRVCQLRTVAPRELLVGPQWTLLQSWLKTGRVQNIFMDYDLQAVLYRHAKRQGARRSQLKRWFQYPRGRKVREGIIRHYPNHRNHIHVRFRCPRSDRACR